MSSFSRDGIVNFYDCIKLAFNHAQDHSSDLHRSVLEKVTEKEVLVCCVIDEPQGKHN